MKLARREVGPREILKALSSVITMVTWITSLHTGDAECEFDFFYFDFLTLVLVLSLDLSLCLTSDFCV